MATKLASKFARTNCGDLLTPSNEPILDSTFQTRKTFRHRGDPAGSAHVVTGLSWQPSCGPEHAHRSFRLDGIRPAYHVALATPVVGHPYFI